MRDRVRKTHGDSTNNLASSVKAFSPTNVIFTGIGVLLTVWPTPLMLEFYMQKGMSEEATELSSTSLSASRAFSRALRGAREGHDQATLYPLCHEQRSKMTMSKSTQLSGETPDIVEILPNRYPAWTPNHTTPSTPP
ncbi:hypothetical protein EDB92DRAFT_1816082 [Lactarius akahatsu]|uniref:Uncharacterized protein n=1 Tax=Lactarius akahatsu TaxID=416441 RepID=A0AAD4LGB5_9AGAM|nr:hypothetical protein EDB92DRAFT_1816082 [Lactarius akahatsu]